MDFSKALDELHCEFLILKIFSVWKAIYRPETCFSHVVLKGLTHPMVAFSTQCSCIGIRCRRCQELSLRFPEILQLWRRWRSRSPAQCTLKMKTHLFKNSLKILIILWYPFQYTKFCHSVVILYEVSYYITYYNIYTEENVFITFESPL